MGNIKFWASFFVIFKINLITISAIFLMSAIIIFLIVSHLKFLKIKIGLPSFNMLIIFLSMLAEAIFYNNWKL